MTTAASIDFHNGREFHQQLAFADRIEYCVRDAFGSFTGDPGDLPFSVVVVENTITGCELEMLIVTRAYADRIRKPPARGLGFFRTSFTFAPLLERRLHISTRRFTHRQRTTPATGTERDRGVDAATR